MKKGQKFRNKKTRRIVYFVESYKEDLSGKTVIRYNHPGHRNEIGAMYRDQFFKEYLPTS